MMKYGLSALVIAGLLTACAPLGKKPQASLFAAQIGSTLLAVKIPARNAEATLTLTAINRGVETWQTGDAVSISLRNGLIVGTRGLGFDVMGSDVQQTMNAFSGARGGKYSVQRSYLSADNHVELVTATCEMARAADGHFVESCTAGSTVYRNEYWLNGSGQVAVSNQWIGPKVQYLSLSYVKSQ